MTDRPSGNKYLGLSSCHMFKVMTTFASILLKLMVLNGFWLKVIIETYLSIKSGAFIMLAS